MRRAGSARPEAISAERTRSRASETALSGRPTMAKAGNPGATCTCTSTARASIPSKAMLDLIGRYRSRGLPTPIDSDALQRVGVPPSLIPRTVQSLHTLDLVDPKTGMPTPTFDALRLAPEDEFKKRLEDWLKGAYA